MNKEFLKIVHKRIRDKYWYEVQYLENGEWMPFKYRNYFRYEVREVSLFNRRKRTKEQALKEAEKSLDAWLQLMR